MLRDDVAEEADGGAAKLALRRLGVELVVPQRLEHHAHVHEVLLARLGEDENVITVSASTAPPCCHLDFFFAVSFCGYVNIPWSRVPFL